MALLQFLKISLSQQTHYYVRNTWLLGPGNGWRQISWRKSWFVDFGDLVLRVSCGKATLWGGENRFDLQKNMQASYDLISHIECSNSITAWIILAWICDFLSMWQMAPVTSSVNCWNINPRIAWIWRAFFIMNGCSSIWHRKFAQSKAICLIACVFLL